MKLKHIRRNLDLYGKKNLIGFTDGKTEFGAKEQMHVYGMTSLITAKDKIEYKAPKMNKLAESGKFKHDKEKRVRNLTWVNEKREEIKNFVDKEEIYLLVETQNYEEGEEIKIEIEEVNKKNIQDGKHLISLSGSVDAEGSAILKVEVNESNDTINSNQKWKGVQKVK